MELKMFTVYDAKAKAYHKPFYLLRTEEARRAFSNGVNDKTHPWGANPEDYILYEMGTFDDNTCKINQHDPIILLCSAIEVQQEE